MVGYYRRRAEHGVGLIVTEGTAIAHPAAVASTRIPRFHGDDALAGWAKVVTAVHAAGGRIVPQLWHVGMARKPGSEPNPEAPPVGPSGLDLTGAPVNDALTEAQVDGLIDAYAQGAADAQRLGFDGIELHGAHGYLIDQFFWERTNQRHDRFGGDLVARTRFASEVIKRCRARTSPEFPIILRFSQWKLSEYKARLVTTPDELAQFLQPLVDAGVDAFHCSTRRFWQPEFAGSDLNLAGWTKKLGGRPTITVGSVGMDNDFMTSLREGQSSQNRRAGADGAHDRKWRGGSGRGRAGAARGSRLGGEDSGGPVRGSCSRSPRRRSRPCRKPCAARLWCSPVSAGSPHLRKIEDINSIETL